MRRGTAPDWVWHAALVVGVVAWWLIYERLPAFAEGVVALLPLDPAGPAGAAIAFFLYDVPKVLLLLTLVVFAMGVVRSFFSAERTRALLSGRREGVGNVMAAGLGVLTPFCSCSAVPLFVGFVSAGIPLGVTLSFLIAAPMVNEVALFLLVGLVGWPVALIYLGFGLTIAIIAGWLIGRLGVEHWLQDWVRDLRSDAAGAAGAADGETPTWPDRYRAGAVAVRDIFSKVWLWIVIGIAVGAFIHGYVPEELLASVMGSDAWWSVPAAVLVGIPMYSNAAGIIPVVEALIGKGAALGTVLAFMMSVIALSLPEMLILKQVLKLRLIALFIAVVAGGILAVGFLFNLLIPA
ncbi:MAG: permease [Alphaproteobacteria bacterium]|nr:permease [Alphaproteobacteria bacterium]